MFVGSSWLRRSEMAWHPGRVLLIGEIDQEVHDVVGAIR
jgi:hypothetical protein